MKKRIVFTGGHHNSALVVANILKKEGFEVFWFGHKFASRGDKSLSVEYQEVVRHNIPFFELKTGKAYRQRNPLEWLKIILGFIQAFNYLLKIKPSLIVSFGGYLAVPTVIAGRILGIKSITHEQTVVSGWANRAIVNFVDKVLLTHKSSLKNYPRKKVKIVGLPIRPEIFDKSFKKTFEPPLIYITCGKQGSHNINQAVFPLIPQLVKKYTVVHQTGSNTLMKDLDKAKRIKDGLKELSNRYIYAPYFFTPDAPSYLQSAKLVISRAGAHQIYELMLLQKRSVLIPIPWVSHNEQYLNAKLATSYLPGTILEEKDLNPENLLQAIDKTLVARPKPKIQLEKDAHQKVVDIIHSYFSVSS